MIHWIILDDIRLNNPINQALLLGALVAPSVNRVFEQGCIKFNCGEFSDRYVSKVSTMPTVCFYVADFQVNLLD